MASFGTAKHLEPSYDDAMLLLDVHRPSLKSSTPKQSSSSRLRLMIPEAEDQELYLAAEALIKSSKSPVLPTLPSKYTTTNRVLQSSYASKRSSRKSPTYNDDLSSPSKSPKKARNSPTVKKEKKKEFTTAADCRKCNYCAATETPMWRHGTDT
jgi:hypothetical protein